MKKTILGLLCGVLIMGIATGCSNDSKKNNELSNNSSSEGSLNSKYQLKINGTELGFPFKLEKLLNIGLEISENDIEKIKNSTSEWERVSLVGDVFTVADFIIESNENINNAKVIGVAIPMHDVEKNYVLEFNGLKREVSTLHDVLEEFGDPEIPEEIDETLYIYSLSYDGGKLIFDFREGILTSMQYIGDK